MTTKRAVFIARNTERHCDVPGCPSLRYNTSRYCRKHRATACRNGHPTAKVKSEADIERHLVLIGRFFNRQSGHASFPAVVKLLTGYVQGGGHDSELTERELARVASHGFDPMAVLARLAAVFALEVFDPRAFPSVKAHTFALGRVLLSAAPLATATTPSGKTRYIAPPNAALQEVGGWIRTVLGPWLQQVTNAILAEEEAKGRLRSELNKPFDQHPLYTAPPVIKPTGAIRTDN